jgi:hypothetical protein
VKEISIERMPAVIDRMAASIALAAGARINFDFATVQQQLKQ